MKKMIQSMGVSLLAVSALTACSGEPEWQVVYDECKAVVEKSHLASVQKPAEGEDEQTRMVRESMNNMVLSMGMTACEMIKSSCEADPDGAACQAYLKK